MTIDQNDSPFVASYTGAKVRYLLGRTFPFWFLLILLLAAYMNDEARQLLSKNQRAEPATPGGYLLLGALVAAAMIDMILVLATFRRGRPALIVSKDGADFIVEGKPATLLQSLAKAFPSRSRHRLILTIRTPLGCIDKSARDIETAIRRFRPDGMREG